MRGGVHRRACGAFIGGVVTFRVVSFVRRLVGFQSFFGIIEHMWSEDPWDGHQPTIIVRVSIEAP